MAAWRPRLRSRKKCEEIPERCWEGKARRKQELLLGRPTARRGGNRLRKEEGTGVSPHGGGATPKRRQKVARWCENFAEKLRERHQDARSKGVRGTRNLCGEH